MEQTITGIARVRLMEALLAHPNKVAFPCLCAKSSEAFACSEVLLRPPDACKNASEYFCPQTSDIFTFFVYSYDLAFSFTLALRQVS